MNLGQASISRVKIGKIATFLSTDVERVYLCLNWSGLILVMFVHIKFLTKKVHDWSRGGIYMTVMA